MTNDKTVPAQNRRIRFLARCFWISLGCAALALGTAGIVLPLVPTVPFYMLTLYCFTKGSKRMRLWFVNTNLYKKHLKVFAEKRAVPLRSKIAVITAVTLMMGAAFIFTPVGAAGKILMLSAWLFHLFYFTFKIKTAK